MLYKIKMTSGHTIQLRGVRKFDYDAKSARFTAVMPGWSKYVGNGVESISIDDDPEWWGATVEIIEPKADEGGAVANADDVLSQDHKGSGVGGEELLNFIRREYCVPRELIESTFAPLSFIQPSEAVH